MRWRNLLLGGLLGTLFFQLFDAAPMLLASQREALSLPFMTQFDGSAYASTDCGPASVAMVIDFETGEHLTPLQARQAIMRLPGAGYAANPESGTAIQDLGRLAQAHGLQIFRGDGPASVGWGPERLRKHLEQGHPVIVLTRVGYLPGYTPGTPIDHYIVLTGATPTGYVYQDPALRNGAGRTISEHQLQLAQRASSVPGQGMAFDAAQGGGYQTAAAVAAPAPVPAPEEPSFTVTVAPGDTLYQIAKRHNVELQAVIALNRATLKNPNLIQVGQVVRIPGEPPAPPADEVVEEPAKPRPVAAGPARQGTLAQ